MTTIDPDPAAGPDQPRAVLDALKPTRAPAPVDLAEPILPLWLRDADVLRQSSARLARITWYRTRKFALYLPQLLLLLTWRSPVGFWRLVASLSVWIYDQDSARLRHEHSVRAETTEAVKVQSLRRANLSARLLVSSIVAGPLVLLVGSWTYPAVTAWALGFVVALWVAKLIPGKHWGEYVACAVIWAVLGLTGTRYLAAIPRPPFWVLALVAAATVLGLGWHGRNREKGLGLRDRVDAPAELVKPTKEMVVDALCRVGITGMSTANAERVHAETKLHAPGVATAAHGYVMEMDLPPGVTVDMVVAKRAELAGALRRDLGTVWPGGNPNRHPAYLRLFLSREPMSKARQPVWPIATGGPIDIFDPIPMLTDEECRWVPITFMGTHAAIGGASGFGKSVFLRQLAVALAFDPRARLIVFDGKRSGDLDCIRRLAHGYHEGAEEDDITAQLGTLRELLAERDRRSRWLGELPAEERSPKVTTTLASKYPAKFSPIVLLIDECQEYTEYGVKGVKGDMKIRGEFVALLTKLARLGRSAGIFCAFVSQKPDATVLPSSIMGNCGIRIAFKVSEQVHNDQILGTSARKNGVDATMFTARDRGMAWIRGGDQQDTQVARSWSEMVDVGVAYELAGKAYAIREARGLLTGQAAGEDPAPSVAPDLLDDVREVMNTEGHARMGLTAIRERLTLLREAFYGPWDNDALGAALRASRVPPETVHCPVEGRSVKGVKRERLDVGEPESA